jgi:hypothetical protein
MPEQILDFLRNKGDSLDYEIAATLGKPLPDVKAGLAALVARGDVVMCHSIQFVAGEQIEGMRCRLSTYVPRIGPCAKAN